MTALSEHRREYHGVEVFQILPLRKFGYIDPETVDNVRHVAFFYGGATRAGGQQGWIDYIPNYFSEMPRMIEDGLLTVDTVFTIC